MNTRRLVCLLLGVWFSGAAIFRITTDLNLHSVETALANMPAGGEKMVRVLGPENARLMLRHHAAELNRLYAGNWEKAQLALGAALFLLMLFWTSVRTVPLAAILAVVAITAAEHWVLTGRMNWYGRALDFGAAPTLAHLDKLLTLRKMYTWTEIAKYVLLAGLSVRFLFSFGGRRHRLPVEEIDVVDNADHSHVDR